MRVPADLEGLDALIIPGGESTVMTLGIGARACRAAPCARGGGIPMLGTCAGMIMLDRDHLGILDIVAERNAFGRQLRSFETELELDRLTAARPRHVHPRAVGRRARRGRDGARRVDGHPVAVRQGSVIALSFHPELAGETRLHELLLSAGR